MKGTVVSNKMTKAIVVAIIRTLKHPKYKKEYKVRKKFHVACSDSSKYNPGMEIEIVSCAPVSKTISFKVVE